MKIKGASEIHRLKPMGEYDPDCFDRIYKVSKPVIRNIVKGINAKRYGLTSDIIQSYFFDKVLHVFNKYYGTCSEEILKAKVLFSLNVFRNKILKKAYGEDAENYTNTFGLDDLYEKDKESVEDMDQDEEDFKKILSEKLHTYMRKHLSHDAYLVFETLISPPLFIMDKTGGTKKITNTIILEYFEEPVDKNSLRYITEIRKDIEYWIEKLKLENHRD